MTARLLLAGGPSDGLQLDFTGYEWPPPPEIFVEEEDRRYVLLSFDDVPGDLGLHPNILITARYEHRPEEKR